MTISSQQGRQPYAGAGTTGPFAVPFKIFAATDLRVVKQSSAGVDTTLVLNVDYTISGTLGIDNGCSVTTTANVAVGETLNLILDPPLTQATDYVSNDAFPAESHERALDRLTQQGIRTRDFVVRTLRQPDGDFTQLAALPARAVRAGRYAAFDAQGDPIASVGTGNDTALRTDLASTVVTADGSRLVGYRRTDAGSLARSVFSRLVEDATITDFGAANGANSSAAVQAAVDQDELATGSPINVPHGRFVLDAAVDVDGTIAIYGRGYYSELELTNAATYRAMLIQHPAFTAINGVRLRDFRVDGNAGGAFDSGLVQLNNAVGFVVDGLWIENGSRVSGASGINGIALSAGTNGGTRPSGTVLNSYFQAMSKGALNISTECDGVTAAFNISKSNTGNGTCPGIQIFGAYRTKVIGNVASGNEGRGIFGGPDTLPNPISYTLIALNHSYGNGTGTNEGDGIALTNANASASHARSIVESNFVVDNGDGLVAGGSGIFLAAIKSVDVRGNWIYDNALHGVFLSAQGAVAGGHIRVVDNVIENNNTKANAQGAGVTIGGTFDTLEVSRNKIVNTDGVSGHRYGIFISDTSVINDLTIEDNDITGMVTANHHFGTGGAQITRFNIRVGGRHQTDDANQDTVFAFPLPDNSACYIKMSAVGVMSDGTQRAAYERAAVIYRDGAGATIQGGAQTSLFSQESNANYDATISVTGNLMTVLIRGDAGQTVNWRWKVEAYSI